MNLNTAQRRVITSGNTVTYLQGFSPREVQSLLVYNIGPNTFEILTKGKTYGEGFPVVKAGSFSITHQDFDAESKARGGMIDQYCATASGYSATIAVYGYYKE